MNTADFPGTGDSPPATEYQKNPDAATVADAAPHDPGRIRGDALRRSLYYTMIAWIPGAFWAGATSGSPAFELAKSLGASDFVFSLLVVVPQLAVLLQIPGALAMERLGARKKFFIWTVTPHRALYIVIGLLPWIMPRDVAWPAMIMILVLAVSMSLSSFGGQAWTHWMADLVPERIRGKYFAARNRMGVLVACLAGLLVALAMDLCEKAWFVNWMAPVMRWSGLDPLIFFMSTLFMLAGFVGMFDILSFIRVDEPPMRPAPRERLWNRIREPIRDTEFRRYVAYASVWTASQSVSGWLWWEYLLGFIKEQKDAGNHAWWVEHRYLAVCLILGVAFQVGQFLGYPIWGRAVDRFGRKPILFISSVVHTIGWSWWIFLCPALIPWLLLTQLFGGFMYCGQDIGQFNIMLQFTRRGGAAYQAVGSVIFSIVGALAGLASGVLAKALANFQWTCYGHTFNRYAVLVAIAIVIKYAGDLILLPAVHDVGGKSRRDALRFVVENTYGSINNLIFLPLRAGALFTGRTLTDVRETLTDAANTASSGIRRWWR